MHDINFIAEWICIFILSLQISVFLFCTYSSADDSSNEDGNVLCENLAGPSNAALVSADCLHSPVSCLAFKLVIVLLIFGCIYFRSFQLHCQMISMIMRLILWKRLQFI